MPTHNTSIQYIGNPEGYRSDIPIAILDNCELTPNSDIGIHYEADISDIGLSFRANTNNSRLIRSLNYDGASRNTAVITLPKQFVTMFGLSDCPITFFPGRGGLVGQITYTPRLQPDPLEENLPESTVSTYSSGHYGIRVPEVTINPDDARADLLSVVTDTVWVWLDQTTTGELVIIVDLNEKRAPENAHSVSANPSMLYRREGELGFLFPIPVGDILLASEPTLRWSRDKNRLIAMIVE